jgi:hypothetical protein
MSCPANVVKLSRSQVTRNTDPKNHTDNQNFKATHTSYLSYYMVTCIFRYCGFPSVMGQFRYSHPFQKVWPFQITVIIKNSRFSKAVVTAGRLLGF